MSWGYGNCGTRTFAQDMQSNKVLINTTESGIKVYKSIVGNGIGAITVLWHDSRKLAFNSKLIIKKDGKCKVFDIPFLKTQKDVFENAEEELLKLNYISKI